jgi:small subunit ribosomal protein S4
VARSRSRGSTSRFAVQLEEKRNLKKIFGVREAQLRRYYREARRTRAKETGPYLVELLERRLDNALYRVGFAETRAQARQMASHRLVEVNEHPVSIPSLRLKKGDVVRVKESKRVKSYFTNFEKKMQSAQPPQWIELDIPKFSFRVVADPVMEEAKLGIDAQAIVELLSR